MRLRSLLYVPADNARFVAGAHTRGADAIILDLEDSVRPENRAEARRTLADSVTMAGQNGAVVMVRINAEPGDMLADARAAVSAGAAVLYVAKANRASIEQLDTELGGTIPFFALIEDPAAMLDARAIAAHPRVRGLAAGGEDLAMSIGAVPGPDTLRIPKLLVHYGARAEGKYSIGPLGSIADYTDLAAIERVALETRQHGYDGASCVHPSIVPIYNRVFSPTPEELVWAGKVIEAANRHPSGAFSLDGQMVDAPVIARAQKILDGQE